MNKFEVFENRMNWLSDRAFQIRDLMMTCCMVCYVIAMMTGYAYADGISDIKTKFGTLFNLLATVIQAFGALVLLWNAFEFGTSIQAQEPTAVNRSLKGIGGGLFMLLAPAIVNSLGGQGYLKGANKK